MAQPFRVEAILDELCRGRRPRGPDHGQSREDRPLFRVSDRLEEILDALDAGAAEGDEWAATEAATIRKKSPMACKVSLKLLAKAPTSSTSSTRCGWNMAIMVRLIHHPDFKEGVRALLIDKDNEPNWHPTNPARDRRCRGRSLLRAAAGRGAVAAVRFLRSER